MSEHDALLDQGIPGKRRVDGVARGFYKRKHGIEGSIFMGAQGYFPVAEAVGVIGQYRGDGCYFWRSGGLVDQPVDVDGIHEKAGAEPGALGALAAVG